MQRSIVIIVNPCAGKKQGNKNAQIIKSYFEKEGYCVFTAITDYKGNAPQLSAYWADKVSLVICVGGDGTLNEIVSGMMLSGKTCPIAYMPTGTTNDFATSWKLPKTALKAAEYINATPATAVDVGKFNDRYFTYVASFGAFTKAAYETSQSVKNVLGHFAYVLEGILELGSLKAHHMRVQADSKAFEGDYIFGAVTNAVSIGGVLSLNEELVDVRDGLFEALFIKFPHNIIELGICLQALRAKQYSAPCFDFCSAKTIDIICDEALPWTTDGEYAGEQKNVSIQNLHNAIQFHAKL